MKIYTKKVVHSCKEVGKLFPIVIDFEPHLRIHTQLGKNEDLPNMWKTFMKKF